MTKLLVQELLRSGKSLDSLKETNGINYNITKDKVCLNYDQINASESDPVASQCRGLVLRLDSWDVVACPMFRFFNLHQGNAADVDINNAAFEEKMDGTCIIVYWDENQQLWCSGTRSRCEADVPIDDTKITFSGLVKIAVNNMYFSKNTTAYCVKLISLQDFMSAMNSVNNSNKKQYTFVFELTSPINRIVCKYNKIELTLLAVRNNITLKEEKSSLWNNEDFGLKTPKLYEFNNINHLTQVIVDWNPIDHEGVVIKDKNFNRVKVKNPAYLALNHMRDSLMKSIRGCIEIILLGKEDDIVGVMPEFVMKKIEYLKPIIKEVLLRTQKEYDEIKEIQDMKTFALEAQKKLWPSAMFALKRGKTTDLKTFSLGNQKNSVKIPSPAINTMLELCKVIDPKITNLELELIKES